MHFETKSSNSKSVSEIDVLQRQCPPPEEKGGIRFSMRSGKPVKTRAYNPKEIAKIQAASPHARILAVHDFIQQKLKHYETYRKILIDNPIGMGVSDLTNIFGRFPLIAARDIVLRA